MRALLAVVLLGVSLWVLVRAPGVAQGQGARVRPALLAQGLCSAGLSVYLLLFVLSEDDYRDNGISRWDAYDAHLVTVAALVAGFAGATLGLAAARSRRRLALPLGLLGVVSALLLGIAFIANSLN